MFVLCKRLLLSQNSLTELAKDPQLTKKTIMKLSAVLLLLVPLIAVANVRRGDIPRKEVRSLQEVTSTGQEEGAGGLSAELTCKILETFDNLGRDENNIPGGGLLWSPLCDDFEHWNEFLCPQEEQIQAIRSAKFPLENPAVKKNWCIPIYGEMEDAERRDDCIKFCTNYVSAARGDCCGIMTLAPTLAPTLAGPTIADFIQFDPDLTFLVEGLERLNNITVDLELIFDGEFEMGENGLSAELTCNILETFDNLGRGENNIPGGGLVWSPLCEDFENWDEFLCPQEEQVEAIRSAKFPLENPAVKKNWCIPIYREIKDAERRDDCIKFCTNYVSAARGDCCGIGEYEVESSGSNDESNGGSNGEYNPCSDGIGCGRKLLFRRDNLDNLFQVLNEPGSFTFFAPNNNAFRKLPEDLLRLLYTSDDHILHLQDLFLYHGMDGKRLVADFADGEVIPSLNSQGILVQLRPFRINGGISMTRANFPATNGVTHVIGGVLSPEWVSNTLLDFASGMPELSMFHGFLVSVNRNLLAFFGDAYTLVAPTNDAIGNIDEATLASWLDPANEEILRSIVDYHIIYGVSTVLVNGDRVETDGYDSKTGESLQILVSVDGDKVMFNQATAQDDGRLANNGILYTIDAVLNPDSENGF